MFRKTLLASAMLAALATPVLANYQTGYIAYQEGRYTSAYIEFKSSADAGNATAQYMLGRLYQEGRGVDRDVIQALAWYDLAAGNGSPEASSARAALAPQMTSYQLQTAANLTTQWRNQSGTVSSPTPTPTPAPVGSYAPYTLRNVQVALNQLGYPVGAADGVIGPKSHAAIRAYQIDYSLPASGEPSVALYDHMQQTLSKQAGNTTPTTSPDSGGVTTTLVAEVQSELRLRDYAIPAINGQLDSATVAAIKRYQADASLTVDGKVSDTLLAQLRSGRADPAMDYRAQVKAVQSALNSRGFDAGPADGALGPKTRAAIRNYQAANGLAVTGEIGTSLMDSLQIASTTPSTPVGAGAQLIAAIEKELIRHNYAAGSIDGTLDAQARSAITLYQRDAGLEITGQATQALYDNLKASSVKNDSDTVSQLVFQIEGELKNKGYRVGPLDGTLDNDTRAGIEAFQKDAQMKVNGKPSEKLLATLESAVVVGSEDGDNVNLLNGREVWEVEARLNARGYNVGAVDTQADSKTYAAVRQYQRDEGLVINGRIDESLLKRLQVADAGQSQGSLSNTEKGAYIIQSLIKNFLK